MLRPQHNPIRPPGRVVVSAEETRDGRNGNRKTHDVILKEKAPRGKQEQAGMKDLRPSPARLPEKAVGLPQARLLLFLVTDAFGGQQVLFFLHMQLGQGVLDLIPGLAGQRVIEQG